jgi:hypothetical protein
MTFAYCSTSKFPSLFIKDLGYVFVCYIHYVLYIIHWILILFNVHAVKRIYILDIVSIIMSGNLQVFKCMSQCTLYEYYILLLLLCSIYVCTVGFTQRFNIISQ